MKPTSAEQVLGELNRTVRDEREARLVERDLPYNALKGRPLRRRLRNFAPSLDRHVASLGGPLPYMVRLRTIEGLTAEHRERLSRAYAETPPELWRSTAERWDFFEVNDLIDRHNRWYPIEARLPMDPRTGDFATIGGRPYRLRPLDAAWILEQFPSSVAA